MSTMWSHVSKDHELAIVMDHLTIVFKFCKGKYKLDATDYIMDTYMCLITIYKQ